MIPSSELTRFPDPDLIDAGVRSAAWDAIVSDPTVGLLIADEEGRAIFCNDRAAEFYHGPGAKGSHCLGSGWDDRLPADAVRRRRQVLEDVKSTGRPVVVRTIFSGLQAFGLIYPVRPTKGQSLRFLILLRTVPGEGSSPFGQTSLRLIETDSIDLGPLSVLSPRELEVLAMVGQSLSSKEIARALHRSEKTIENHRYSISKKLAGANAQELAALARQAGLTLRDARRHHRNPLEQAPKLN